MTRQAHPDGCTCDQPWHHRDRAAYRAQLDRENQLRAIRRTHGKETLHGAKLARAGSRYTDRVAWSEQARRASRRTYARRTADQQALALHTLDPELFTVEERTRISDLARQIHDILLEAGPL